MLISQQKCVDFYNKIGNLFLEVIYYQDRNIKDKYNFSWFDTRKAQNLFLQKKRKQQRFWKTLNLIYLI